LTLASSDHASISFCFLPFDTEVAQTEPQNKM